MLEVTRNVHTDFYPRSPCGERLVIFLKRDTPLTISIHALLAESDISVFWMAPNRLLFLSTLSLRRATAISAVLQLTPLISIHALLAESDNTGQPVRGLPSYFYPRSPCGERRSEHR